MEIEILAAESLGVRGLCCYVKTKTKKILIDPGIALGYSRYNHLPHPFQIAVDEKIRKRIIVKWSEATDYDVRSGSFKTLCRDACKERVA